jgi:hypothetical protein
VDDTSHYKCEQGNNCEGLVIDCPDGTTGSCKKCKDDTKFHWTCAGIWVPSCDDQTDIGGCGTRKTAPCIATGTCGTWADSSPPCNRAQCH